MPFADTSTYAVPEGASDEEVLMLADILPTSYEVGVLNGRVAAGRHRRHRRCRPDRPVGHPGGQALLPEQDRRHRPGRCPSRCRQAVRGRHDGEQRHRRRGRRRSGRHRGAGRRRGHRGGRRPRQVRALHRLVRPGGHVANIGVHGKPATLHLETLWTRDVTVTTGLVDTFSTPTLLRLVAPGRSSPIGSSAITSSRPDDGCL